MPVFKKQVQGNDGEKKENENENQNENAENLQQPQKQQQPQLQQQSLQMQPSHSQPQPDQMQMNYEQHYYDYEDLMPDPMQYVTLMGAPPPPPSEPPPIENEDDDEKDILPPGVDETETDLIPKPISDAPIPKTGPLPKDFEEALNIIFPGEKKSDENEANDETKENNQEDNTNQVAPPGDDMIDQHHHQIYVENMNIEETIVGDNGMQIINDESSQVSLGYPMVPGHAAAAEMMMAPPQEITGIGFMPPSSISAAPSLIHQDIYNEQELNFEHVMISNGEENQKEKEQSPTNSEKLRRQEELDDLAMLGIDADDLAAQCI